MYISELYQRKSPVLSFEVFPPKKDGDVAGIDRALEKLADLQPDFVSVTYGAGGSGSRDGNPTQEIAASILRDHGIPSLAHLTCITSDRSQIRRLADDLWNSGVRNILAMRGDFPRDATVPLSTDYRYAHQLIRDLLEQREFCIGAACYPEGHIECDSYSDSIAHLKQKQEAGATFLITQLFFDNTLFYRFREEISAAGIALPVSAGVMPILSRSQIERMIFMCGSSLPSAIIKLLHKYESSPEDLRKAGVEYAVAQMEDLVRQGADGIHVYTMNRPSIARQATKRIREITK